MRIFFLYFARLPPPPHKFSNGPSLNRGFTVIVYNRNNVVVADAVVGLIGLIGQITMSNYPNNTSEYMESLGLN